jgi:hypothetical protein
MSSRDHPQRLELTRLDLAAALIFLTLAMGACDRRTAPYVPLEQEPPPPERPFRIPGLATPETQDSGLLEAGSRSGAVPAQAEAGAGLLGTLRLAPGVTPHAGGVVFVIARSAGAAGPPLAVRRMPLAAFPMSFEIGPGDVMIPGRALAGPVLLTARVDTDGNPLTRDAEDLEGGLPSPVEPPARDLEIVLGRGS